MSEYKPVSWNGEPISNAKLNQMANNTQYLFERAVAVRWVGDIGIRDTATKMISGKTPFGTSADQYIDCPVYFGSYFTAGCKPIITAIVETQSMWLRKYISIRGLNGQVDNMGFIAHVVSHENTWAGPGTIDTSGWVHWTAVGW